jgi:hypothetical protein
VFPYPESRATTGVFPAAALSTFGQANLQRPNQGFASRLLNNLPDERRTE